jgi:predicted AAA+ superfamily ATPase
MGPRRVGKTVMIFHAVERLLSEGISSTNILYLSIDTPIYTDLALEKIVNIFQAEFEHGRDAELFIIFDEIQYLSEWELHLKSLVDSYPSYKFVATGSLKLKSRESGAGRFTDFLLPPLTFAEYIYFISSDTKDINKLNTEFVNYLNYGGYPRYA